MESTPCEHYFVSDPWEPQVERCLYCRELFEDVIPLKLPAKAPTVYRLNSPLVRALRNLRCGD